MGMATNIVVFTLVLSFVIYSFNHDYHPLIFDFLACFWPELTLGIAACDATNPIALAASAIAILASGAAVAASIFFPDVIKTFAIPSIILLGLMTFPMSLMNSASLSTEFKILVGGVFGVSYLLAYIGWLKGTGEP